MAQPSRSIRHTNSGSTNPSRFVIGTFNVRGFNAATKRDQLSEDLGRLHIDICCLQETKCPGGFDERSGNYRHIGLPSRSRHYGLAFSVAIQFENQIVRYWSVSDRIAVIQLRISTNSILTIINVYGPTSQRVNNNNAEQDEFYAELARLTSRYSSSALFYIAGDFNSKIGYRKDDENFMGHHSRGRRNINGIALADFLEVHGLFICNTAFQHSARHKTTWQGQRRDVTTGQVVPIYNVIDFVICPQTHKRLLTDSRSYSGTLLHSDHRLLVAKLDLRQLFNVWGCIEKARIPKHVRYNTDLLVNDPYREMFRAAVSDSISEVNTNTTASERWTSVEHVLKSAAESTIGKTVATTRRDTPHCSEMAAMSEKQRQLKLWQQNTRNSTTRADIKRQRNTLLHAMRRKSRDNAEARLDRMASEVERLHDGAKMFRAVREMTRKPVAKLTIHDNSGRTICNAAEINARVTEHFSIQFSDPSVDGLNAFTETLSRITHRITPAEIKRAIGKLNSGRASGHDDIPAELFKCSADLLAQPIADIFNDALEHHEPLGLGKGVLILIQKPGKPKGPLTSVRPIVLLTTLRKTLSLVVLSRIAPKVDEYLSPSQSGFRRGRSTADVLFGYRWLCAKAQRQRVSIELLGIDLSRAFDTIRRDKLLDILQTFLGESEMRIIRLLLADTSLEPRLSTGECHAFATSIGTPQGDSLSPVLFTVYLEAALRDLRSRLPTRPQTDANLPLDVEYADDTDFISTSRLFLDDIERIAPACLAEWSLTINASKTERSSVCRHADRVDEEWRMTRKLGSLLGEAEDVARRKQLANVAFRKLSTVWFRRSRISLPLRLRLYESFVVPVLIYNMGTWGLTKAELDRLDAYHRRHLRQIVGIHWPHRISNTALYRRCRCHPISEDVKSARWRLFGHVLRMPRDTPAQQAIDYYFADTGDATFRGRPRTSLPTALSADLRRVGRTLRRPADIDALRLLNREQWRQLERDIAEESLTN